MPIVLEERDRKMFFKFLGEAVGACQVQLFASVLWTIIFIYC